MSVEEFLPYFIRIHLLEEVWAKFVLLPYLLVTPSVTPITSKEAVGQGHAREMSSISIQGLGEEEGCWEGGVQALLELHILPL